MAKREKRVKLEGYDELDGLYVPESWLPKTDDWGNGFRVKDNVLVEYKANAADVVIPEGITAVEEGVFSGKNIHTLHIPKSLTKIGATAFRYCSSFEKITVEDGHPDFHVDGNCLINTKKKTIIIGLKNSVIPSDGSVTKIGKYAFVPNGWGWNTDVTIPDAVTEICERAFSGCGIVHLTLPSSIKKLGKGAFAVSEYLETAVIPEGITEISESCFTECSALKSVKLPESVTVIGKEAFYQCENLEDINLPSNLEKIGFRAFLWSNKWYGGLGGRLFITKRLKIESSSFPRIGLEHITVEDGNPYYYSDGDCLIDTETKTVVVGCKNSVIPHGVKKIGELAFYYCKGLKQINIPDSVEEIGGEAFEYCTELKSAYIPNSVKKIGGNAFRCREEFWHPINLKSVTVPKRFAGDYDIFEDADAIEFKTI